jgi:hypothetical protein
MTSKIIEGSQSPGFCEYADKRYYCSSVSSTS